jgi:uncharacterized membrane protein YidH (DUF202 family)
MVLIGVVLALLGVGALVFGGFGFTQKEQVAKVGPVELNKEEHHSISVPTIGGVALVVVGLGFVFVGMRRT